MHLTFRGHNSQPLKIARQTFLINNPMRHFLKGKAYTSLPINNERRKNEMLPLYERCLFLAGRAIGKVVVLLGERSLPLQHWMPPLSPFRD